MRPELAAYLKAALRRPWQWGEWDCCRFAAEWVMANGHPDPMLFLAPWYDSERSALLTIKRGGGLVALWERGMADAGVAEADDAQAGDIAVIERPTEDGIGEALAIFTGERWASLGLRGVEFAPAGVLAMWRP
jgi:hypothetical protein